jgi:TatD DNase family protein
MSKKKFPPYNIYPGLIDSHTHLLHMQEKEIDLNDLFQKLQESGFSWILDVAVDEFHFEERIALLESYNALLFSVGIHPEAVGGKMLSRMNILEKQVTHEKVVALGEIGLDYYWDKTSPGLQKDFFEAQLQVAQDKNLPVIIHNREADEDCLSILKNFPLSKKGVIHCYSSDGAFARKILDLGFYLSFAGNVTYKSAATIREALILAPLNRILVETDAPYLSPQERRGKVNHPGQLGYTADFICTQKGIGRESLVEQIEKNFLSLFQS